MKAIVLKVIGEPENLTMMEIPVPSIKEDEVLVNVKAISVNPVDAFARRNQDSLNYVYQVTGDEPYYVLGWDIAGIVMKTGSAVSKFRVGDEVFGLIKFPGKANGYAEFVAAPQTQLEHKPENISFEEAAGAGLAALTAWQSIVTNGQIKKGDKVIIHGASGGVGHYAVQFAKSFGAYVIGVGSDSAGDFILGLGADEFISFESQKFEELVTDADIVHDSVWSDDANHIERSLNAIKPGGKLLSLIVDFDEPFQEKLKAKNVAGYRIFMQMNEEDLKSITNLLTTGKVKTHVSKIFPFEDMAKAHAHIQTKNAVGKVIVTLESLKL